MDELQLTPQQIKEVAKWMKAQDELKETDIPKRFYEEFIQRIYLVFKSTITGDGIFITQKRVNR